MGAALSQSVILAGSGAPTRIEMTLNAGFVHLYALVGTHAPSSLLSGHFYGMDLVLLSLLSSNSF